MAATVPSDQGLIDLLDLIKGADTLDWCTSHPAVSKREKGTDTRRRMIR
jgi:hypothetical protein